jgi:hypothetical protein
MAAQREVSQQQGEWLPTPPISLDAGTGWGATAFSADAKEANAGTGPAREQEPQPRYLTTSGLFERPQRPQAWKEATLESTPPPAQEPSELVNEFRSALPAPQANEAVRPRKSGEGILALAVVGILLAAAAATIYLRHPAKSAIEFQTAKTWMVKQWTSDLQEFSSAFHLQAGVPKTEESNHRRGLGAYLRERKSANLGGPAAPASVWERPTENPASFDLYITDSYGRRWILTPAGDEFGPLNHSANASALDPGAPPMAPTGCRSPVYHSRCP